MGIRRREWSARRKGVVPTPSPSSSPDSTLSSSSEHHHPPGEPGQGAQRASSVPSAPNRQGLAATPASMPWGDQPTTAGDGGESVRRDVPDPEPLATDACTTPQIVSLAATAVAVGDSRVDWSKHAAAGQKTIPGGAAGSVGEFALEPGMVKGMVEGVPEGEMFPLTDEDLLDAATLFLGGEGLLENEFPL